MLKYPLLLSLLLLTTPLYANNQLDKRMEMLKKLDMLDALDFIEALETANTCTEQRSFSCASENIAKAKRLAESDGQKKEVRYAIENLSDEKHLVELEHAEHKMRAEERRRKEREEELAKKRKKREKREIRRLEKEQKERESTARAQQWSKDLDKRINSQLVDVQRTLQSSQNEINRAIRQSENNKAQRQKEAKERENSKREENYRRQRLQQEREQQRIADARKARIEEKLSQEKRQLAQEKRRITQAKMLRENSFTQEKSTQASKKVASKRSTKKYILAVESVAFCWESKITSDNWRCIGPTQLTTLYGKGLIEQAEMSGCKNPSNNLKQAWSSGDKQGYVMHCQTPLRKTTKDVAKQYAMPNYIRVKRKVYKCSYPLQANCQLYSTGKGIVPNWQTIEE